MHAFGADNNRGDRGGRLARERLHDPARILRKRKPVALTERATAREHLLDLCRLFDHPTPAEDDPVGDHFTFERLAQPAGPG